jgi:hypothetical protein
MLETTAIYTHDAATTSRAVISPLDRLTPLPARTPPP